MANDKSNIGVGKPKANGAVFVAPYGTAAPTDASTALDEAFKCVGYISDGGVETSIDGGTSVESWDGDEVINVGATEKVKLSMLERNKQTLEARYGAENVVSDSSGNVTGVKHTALSRDIVVLVIETVLRHGVIQRDVYFKAQPKLADLEAITYAKDKAIEYGMSYTCTDVDGEFGATYWATTADTAGAEG